MKKCRKILARLHALAQDEIDAAPAEELMNHLSECPACSETFDGFRQMRSLLWENIPAALTCPDIAGSVLKRASELEEAPTSPGFAVRWTGRQLAAAAAIVVLVLAGFFYLMGPFGPRRVVARSTHISLSGGEWKSLEEDIRGMAEISTSARERRSLKLENGVIVILNEKTALETRSVKQLNLLKGDIYVDTAGHRGIELSVKTDHATAHVTGTRFGVSTDEEGTTVVVEEGEVTVESEWGRQAVWAGYGYRIARTGRPVPPEPVDVDEVFSWIKERRRLAKMMTGAAVSQPEQPQPVQSVAVEQESPATRVFGFVRDERGYPVADAELKAMEAGTGARISGAATTTKSDGSYNLGGLRLNNPVAYKLVASAQGYGPALSEAFVFNTTPKEIDITLPRCGSVGELPGVSEDVAEALVDAVAGGDLEHVQFLLGKGADIETRNANGETLLLVAAQAGHSEVAKYLVEAGADVNVTRGRCSNCPTPLFYAAGNGDFDLVKLLLATGADIDAEVYQELSPLGSAAAIGNLEIVKLLLEAGAEANKADSQSGRTILHSAFKGSNPEVVKLLLQSGAEVEPDIELPPGLVAPEVLHSAAEHGTPEIMGLLLDAGADIEISNRMGQTPLAYAAQAGNTDMVRFLIQRGAVFDPQDSERTTPLMCAAASGRIESIELLLAAGADVNTKTRYGDNTLYSAVFGYSREKPYRPDTVRFLKAAGAQEVYEDRYGMPELMWAVAEDDLARAQSLIDKGADVNESSPRKETALSLAARLGLPEMAKLLLAAGADVAPDDSTKYNPLMFAILPGSESAYEVVRLLLDAGADPNAQDTYSSALIKATHSDNDAVLELLLSRGADPNVQDRNGYSALMWAAGRGKKEMVRSLLNYGADTEIRRNPEYGGETVLINAVQQGHLDTVKLLIDHGANINYTDEHGRTALYNAMFSGRTDIAKLLLERGAVLRFERGNPLLGAASQGRTQVVRFLLENGADPNTQTSRYGSNTALMSAASGGHAATAELLLAYGADANASTSDGRTALMMAAEKGHTSTVKLLVANCADMNAKNEMGNTALVIAVAYGRKEIIQFLQEIMGKEESEAQHYFTPLMWAAAKDDIEGVKALLKTGVDVDEKEAIGGTVLDGTIIAGKTEIMKLLLDAGAKFDIRKGLGEYLLYQTIRAGRVDVMRLLLSEREIDVNYSSGGTTTLLMDSLYSGNEDMVRLLIEYGADVNARCQGRTVLEVAEERGNKEIIKLLEEAGARK